MMEFGDRLKMLREQKGFSQSDLCKILNVDQSTLANYENNRRMPKLDMMFTLAKFFNVSVDYLLHNVNIANSYIYGGNSGIRNSGEYSSGATRGIIQDIVFENCNIIGTFYGAALVKGSRVTFRNCHLVQTNATTGYDAGYFEDLDYLTLENCTFESADNVNRRDLAVINCTNVNIKNCTAVNSRVIFTGSSGNWLNNIGMGTHNNRTTEIPNISSGTAAPSTTPIKVGNIFVDTVNNKIYISDGTTSSGNWKILN